MLAMAGKAMAGVKKWFDDGVAGSGPRAVMATRPIALTRTVSLVAIGTSTGGPAALHRILIDLPTTFTVPIVVVQHMSRGFIDGLAKRLSANVALKVVVADDGQILVPGNGVPCARRSPYRRARRDGRVALSSAAQIGGFRTVGRFSI